MTSSVFASRGITTVFFDIDDTLWWFTANSKVALRLAFHRAGYGKCARYDDFVEAYEPLNARLWKLYGRGEIERDKLMVQRFREPLEKIGVTGRLDDKAMSLNNLYLDLLCEQPLVVPGAIDILDHLHRKGYTLCALSNGFDVVQQRKLACGGMNRYIKHLVLSDHCGITKPQRGIFDYALRVSCSEAAHTLLVGDDADTDMQGAHNAGWATIHLMMKDEPAPCADASVTRLQQIKELL